MLSITKQQVGYLVEMETKSKGDITFQEVYYMKKTTDVGKDVEKWNFHACW
jgi:hypothetical protein